MLLELMKSFPDKKLLVLCGHTHTGTSFMPSDNISVLVGGADRGYPVLQGDISLE